jgi:hypothetical protein
MTTKLPTWADAATKKPPSPWTLASEVWKLTKARSSYPRRSARQTSGSRCRPVVLTPGGLKFTPADEDDLVTQEVVEIREGNRLVERRTLERLAAAVLAAWVCLAPLAPQQAKREAYIATAEGSYVAGDLVSRQRAAQSSRDWGWTS